MDPYPGSQSLQLVPIMQAVFADVQSRNIQIGRASLDFQTTPYPPPPTDTGLAYFLAISERFAHVKFSRVSPNAEVELLFGTGGSVFGPRRTMGHMAFSSTFVDLMSLMVVCWITRELSQMDLVPWDLNRIKQYYTATCADPRYTNYLRTFCFTVLGIAENAFISQTNNVGYATDYDDQ
jgi:hypothetical protein